MTIAARRIVSAPSAIEIFLARAEARASLYDAGELDLHNAVDALQETAIAAGLLEQIGQDAVQQILADAFARVK